MGTVALIQTVPGTLRDPYNMSTKSIYHPRATIVEVRERIEQYLYSLSESLWPVVKRTLTLTLPPSSSKMYREIGVKGCLGRGLN